MLRRANAAIAQVWYRVSSGKPEGLLQSWQYLGNNKDQLTFSCTLLRCTHRYSQNLKGQPRRMLGKNPPEDPSKQNFYDSAKFMFKIRNEKQEQLSP